MTAHDALEFVNSPAGIAALTLVILWAGAKKVWVYGKVHEDALERERAATQRERERGDEWKEIATGVTTLADKAVSRLEKT